MGPEIIPTKVNMTTISSLDSQWTLTMRASRSSWHSLVWCRFVNEIKLVQQKSKNLVKSTSPTHMRSYPKAKNLHSMRKLFSEVLF
jgi:hypothetical protein